VHGADGDRAGGHHLLVEHDPPAVADVVSLTSSALADDVEEPVGPVVPTLLTVRVPHSKIVEGVALLTGCRSGTLPFSVNARGGGATSTGATGDGPQQSATVTSTETPGATTFARPTQRWVAHSSPQPDRRPPCLAASLRS
jgi:hypothetical protein